MLFLDLYSADRKSSYVSQEERRIFYEKGLRPALVDLLVDRANEIPATYSMEMARAKAHNNGAHKFASKTLPAEHIRLLGNRIQYHLVANGFNWGTNIAYLHEIKGVKNTFYHPFNRDENESKDRLYALLERNHLKEDVIGRANWYVDVGVEISSPEGLSLFWRTDSHYHLAMKLLEVDGAVADRLTSRSSTKYYLDTTSHIVDAAGFRLTTGKHCGPRNYHYIQTYQTDKHITARKDGFYHGKYFTAQDIIQNRYKPYLKTIFNIYQQASEENHASARLEVRVDIAFAPIALHECETTSIRDSLLAFPTSTIWYVVSSTLFIIDSET